MNLKSRWSTLAAMVVVAGGVIGLASVRGVAQPPVGATEGQDAAEPKYSRPPEAEIRRRLTNMQYRVTQSDRTEPAFRNAYWNNKKAGIYVDIVSGEPLFASVHKFRSGTGWPSFYRPLVPANIVQRRDFKMFFPRIEVRSRHGDSHLGHVFSDGPRPTGLRYCINSAALKFIPAEDLEKEGYDEFTRLFPQPQAAAK